MTTTNTLKALGGEGVTIEVKSGPLAGMTGTVTRADAFPDDHEHRRKVTIEVEGQEIHILPRQIEPVLHDGPVRHVEEAVIAEEAAAALHVVASTSTSTTITDPMDPALDRFRPSTKVVKEYVSRMLCVTDDFKGYKDTDYLLHLRDMRDSNGYSPNVALVGETQSGKTMLVEVLAVLTAEADGHPKPYPVFTLNGSSGISNYDMYGMNTAVTVGNQEQLVWMDGLVDMAVNAGGILYLDEWNAVPPSQAVAIHPILDDRRSFTNYQKAVPNGHGGWAPAVSRASTNLWVISTINPGYRGTQQAAEATVNRFRWIPWDYDEKTERKLIKSKQVRLFGDELRELHASGELKTPIGTSALQRFNQDVALLGPDAALSNMIGMFAPKERVIVKGIFETNNYRDLLFTEYPQPTHMGRELPEEPEVAPEPLPEETEGVEDALSALLRDISSAS